MEQADWKDIIKERIEAHSAKVTEITTILRSVVNQLGHSPYNLKVDVNLVNKQNPTWEVTIANRTESFNYKDFKTEIIPPMGMAETIVITLEEAVQGAILDKFKWEL
ncbi:hypothetical protein [Ammoniphilus resinae]|uniref:Uncharacterized protein n=1 Tax=Ammoniphilus resinae TaxID=861532 RepID=A0ABS4GXM4_9BACL|nr:hypothetical protein [Ammoniphilus resinae]MBP1935030.1 hypothetical protein [Ammoniphilus resinae]